MALCWTSGWLGKLCMTSAGDRAARGGALAQGPRVRPAGQGTGGPSLSATAQTHVTRHEVAPFSSSPSRPSHLSEVEPGSASEPAQGVLPLHTSLG